MSANNTEFENNSSEELQTNADDGNKDDESTTSTSQQALKQLNQLTASNSGTTTTVNKTIITTTTTTAMPKIEPKLAISGGTKIVYIKNANGTPSLRIGNQLVGTSGQTVISANTATNNTNPSNAPSIRKVQLVQLKNKNVVATAPLTANNAHRIVLKGTTLLTPGGVTKTTAGGTTTRTLTVSQAQQMGLLSTNINKSNATTSSNATSTTTKTLILPASSSGGSTSIAVKNQPTILNKGVKPIQSKLVIQSDTGTDANEQKPKSINTQNLIKVTGQQMRAVSVPGKGLQYVRVLSTLPTGSSVSGGQTAKVVNGGRQQQLIHQRKILPQQQQTTQASAAAKQFITRKLEVLPVGSGAKLIKKESTTLQPKVPGTYLLNNVQKSIVTSSIDIKPVTSNQSDSFEITETKVEPLSPSESPRKFTQRSYSTSNERRSKSPDGNHSNLMYSTLKLPSPDPMEGGIRRKHCNCTKSQCLKLYCDCFANGEFCSNCNCKECFNTLEKEDERQKAIKICLERNPHAFKPKIGKSRDQSDTLRRHTKGCNCKRSGCLKNYCECYEAKIACSANCKCLGCRNIDDHMENNDRDGSQYELNQTVKRTYGQIDEKIKTEPIVPPKKPCNFITPDVIEATVQCIIAQADDCTKNACDAKTSERKIIEEFGRCLVEIIEFSKKNNDNPDD